MICIPLTQGKHAIIDNDDWELVSKHKWCAMRSAKGNHTYAATHLRISEGKWTSLKMHRLILGVTEKTVYVDHRDGDTLNNTKSNLRTCTPTQNVLNSRVPCTNTSGLKGAFLLKRTGRWYSRITHKGNRINLGTFGTAEEAHLAYRDAANRLHGDFARLA